MQWTQLTAIIAFAASASAVAIERGAVQQCNSIALCQIDGKSYCEPTSTCTASSGSPYCCQTTGVVNVLDCVNLLDGNSVSISLPVNLELPITLPINL